MQDPIVIASAARTPMGGFLGELASVTAPELGAAAIRAAVERASLEPEDIDEDKLKTEMDEALARSVFGSPYIVVDGEPFWGADRLDHVDRWLATGGW